MNRLILTVPALLAFAMLSACGGSTPQAASEPAPATQTASPPAATPVVEATATQVPATEASASEPVSYVNQVKPILDNKCIKCHGVDSTKEGLDMLTYESLLAGSFNGAVIVPGDANNSLTVQSIAEGEMPKRGTKVTPEELQLIIDWVNQGALNN